MSDLPSPGYYIGGPLISPSWLAGRRIHVRRVWTWAALCRFTGHRDIPDSDDCLRRGQPMNPIRDPKKPIQIEARTMRRGRVVNVTISVGSWDGTPA